MKTIFLLFACTCLLSGLSALNFPLEDENFNAETFENAFKDENDDGLEIFFPNNGNLENLIAPYPTRFPTTTTTTTTTTSSPSSTPSPTPTTSTRPTPPRPTPPRPTPPRPTPPGPNPPRPTPPGPTPPRPTPPGPNPPRPTPPGPNPPRPTPPGPNPPRPTPPGPNPPRPTPPGPNPPRPVPGNDQIYENTVRGLGPFASQLVNVVLNREGLQKTLQGNDIIYNFGNLRRNRDLSNEETQE